MAVHETEYCATDALILPPPSCTTNFHKTSVHAHHWQLRSLISAPDRDCVYYPNNKTLYRLNIKTYTEERVATLKFEPRCLSAARGWIYCGGEYGQVAIIRLVEDERKDEQDIDNGRGTPADSRLPIDLDSTRRSRASPSAAAQSTTDSQEHSSVKSTKIGEEIVNCVTFWFPPSSPLPELHATPVAVLANNDKTVTIADLRSSDEIQTISFADCINRAVISPDGKMLIAIGDDPFMYVFTRDLVLSRGQFSRRYQWVEANKIQLIGQYESDHKDTRGSFAANFSKSGQHLAVGTQYGVISIFDTVNLADPETDPLKSWFTTSRPKSREGAVRDLAFSPEPYDLLTWTEHSGRVGIADARDNFMSRQIIAVDSRARGMRRITAIVHHVDAALVSESDARHPTGAEIQVQAEIEAAPPSRRSNASDALSYAIEQRRRHREGPAPPSRQSPDSSSESTAETSERQIPVVRARQEHGRPGSSRHAYDQIDPPSETSAIQIPVLQALQEQRLARDAMREQMEASPEVEAAREADAVIAAGREQRREALLDSAARYTMGTAITTMSGASPTPAEAAASDGDGGTIRNTLSGARVNHTSRAIDRYRTLLANRTTSPSTTLPSILNQFTADRSTASLRAFITERNQDRERQDRERQIRERRELHDRQNREDEREDRVLRAMLGQQSQSNEEYLNQDRERQVQERRELHERQNREDEQHHNLLTFNRIARHDPARHGPTGVISQDVLLPRHPPRLRAIGSDSPNSPWAELETLYNIAVDPPVDISARLRIETEDDRTHLIQRLADRGLADLRPRSRNSARIPDRIDPDETCGCSWSPDGRSLWVATEDGVFQYQVNTIGRKFFPSLTLR